MRENVALRSGNIIEVCAGAGGLGLGVSLACEHAKTVCYIERETYAAATLVARMEDSSLDNAPIWDDLTTFDCIPWRGKVDTIIAGIPCQGAIAPNLEPAVCRMAHWMAYRVDRLRLCGNGVYPLAAAYAYRTLSAAIEETK